MEFSIFDRILADKNSEQHNEYFNIKSFKYIAGHTSLEHKGSLRHIAHRPVT